MQSTKYLAALIFIIFSNGAMAGIIANYKFDGNLNDSASANVATATGNISFVTGVNGQAVNLDNYSTNSAFYQNEFLQLQDMTLGSNFSIAYWVRFDSNAHSRYVGATFSAGRDGTGEVFRNQVTAQGGIGASVTSNGANGGVTFADINNGQFRHVAVVVASNTIQMFIDGILFNSSTLSGNVNLASTQTFVGLHRWVDGGNKQSSRFDGAIDDLYVFDYALSSQEVSQYAGVSEPPIILMFLLGLAILNISRPKSPSPAI